MGQDFQNKMVRLRSGISEQKIVQLGREFQNWENSELDWVMEKRHEN